MEFIGGTSPRSPHGSYAYESTLSVSNTNRNGKQEVLPAIDSILLAEEQSEIHTGVKKAGRCIRQLMGKLQGPKWEAIKAI